MNQIEEHHHSQTREPTSNGLSLWKKLLYAVLATVIFFALAEGLLAVLGVRSEEYQADPYVGFSGSSPLYVETTGADGTPMMERAPGKKALFNQQRFPVRKPVGAFRIFCVGGSTTYGRPYGDVTSFCGWLREFLNAADPGRRWEVINAGGISYASYRVTVLMEELVEYDPDLFVVYSGHNEFLERRTYPQIIAMPRPVRGVGALASKTRTWTAISRLVGSASAHGGPDADPDVLSSEVVTLLDDAVGPSAYSRDDELAEKVLQHFQFNLHRMIQIARSGGARIVMVTPAANLRDAGPFKSQHRDGLTPVEENSWNVAVRRGIETFRGGDAEGAIEALRQAAEIDPRYAELQYVLGQALDSIGRFDESKVAFERARDEDVCPLRALGPMPDIVREVAAAERVPVVDFVDIVENRSPGGIPGANVFLDHVHPTIDGNRMLGLALLDYMISDGIVQPDSSWGEETIREVTERVEGGLDAHAHAIALTNLSKVIGWAGKLGESYRLSRQAVELDPEDVRVQYQAGLAADLMGRTDEAMYHYLKAIEIQPDAALAHGNLAVGLEKKGRMVEAVSHYRIAYENSSPEDLNHHRENLVDGLVKLAFLLYGRGELDSALGLLEEAERIAPDDPEVLNRLATALMASGRTEQAVTRLETAIAVRPGDAGAHNRLALALALEGRPARAAEAYARALEFDPAVADAPDNLFTVLDRMGRAREAEEIRGLLE